MKENKNKKENLEKEITRSEKADNRVIDNKKIDNKVNDEKNNSEKMRVLYLINHAGQGGSERYLKLLMDNIDCIKYLCYNEEGLLVKETKDRNIECFNLTMKSPFDLKAARKLAKIVKENDIDIVHTQYLRENYVAILSKLFGNKAKIIYTCHFNQYDTKLVSIMNSIFYRWLDKVISISTAVTDSLIKSGCPKIKIELVYHGVEVKEEIAPTINMKEKLGVTNNDFVISSGSRFAVGKGNEFLIKAIKKLKSMTDKKFKVLLANEGETLNECKELVKTLGLKDTVKFIGFMENINDLYLASDIYVTASESEGLGLATLEALSYGVPNVVTAVGGLCDIVNDYNMCGIKVPFGDEKAMATALLKLMNDDELMNEYKKNAKKIIEEKFNIKKMMFETQEIYKDILINLEEGEEYGKD